MVYSLRIEKIPKTLVIGAKGFLGRHFLKAYRCDFPEALGTHHTAIDGLERLNFLDFSLNFLKNKGYRYAVIAAGVCSPAACESKPTLTHFINVDQTITLAKALEVEKIVPILFSSDYVFDGKEDIYYADSSHTPLNQYGKEKAELETRARKELGRFCLIRMSKIYGCEKGDGSIFDEMAARLETGLEVKAAIDQMLFPLHVKEVVQRVLEIQRKQIYGLFNFSSLEPISRFDAAMSIASQFNAKNLVRPMLLDELQDGVKRPKKVKMKSAFEFSPVSEHIMDLTRQYRNDREQINKSKEVFV